MKQIFQNGNPVTVKAAALHLVWIENMPGEIKHHYTIPPANSKRTEMHEELLWHVKLEENGVPLCEGKWMTITHLTTKGGHDLLIKQLEAMNPEHAVLQNRWLNSATLKASELLKPTPENEFA